MNVFSIVPIEVATDSRLTKMQIKVLIAILSFRNKNTDTCYPKRKKLSARCGYSERTISKVTSQLVTLGWLEKTGSGGYSSPCTYKITVPDSATVSKPDTFPDSATITVSKPATTTVSKPDTRKEQTNEHTNEQTKRAREDAFELFWKSYPNRKGKGAARKSWAKIKPDQSLQYRIMDALEKQKRSSSWLRDSGKYIPYPATWLNQERWDDDPDPVQDNPRPFVP